YSSARPDLPYAALIGQAILASPAHALTLQQIYAYITTVYPHFSRDEQTWQASVRHVLSTNAVFRKSRPERGRIRWAIFDADLPCFDGGGFRKDLCADMQAGRKRPAPSADADSARGRTAKRARQSLD
ncbi:winged helix DNA-binding domain-containing protein, partial [Auriscalpium vulgare]